MAYPLPSRVGIGSVYGAPRDGGKRRHKGVDLFQPRGTPVLATEDGVIGRAGYQKSAGNRAWITSSGGNSFFFAHLDKLYVKNGQQVKRGDIIGTVGTSGNAKGTPPHLHFEHKVNGANVNPSRYLQTGELSSARDIGGQAQPQNSVVSPMLKFPNLPIAEWIKAPLWWEHGLDARKMIQPIPFTEMPSGEGASAGTPSTPSGGQGPTGDVRAQMMKAFKDSGITDPGEIQAAFNIAKGENAGFIPGLKQRGGGPGRGLFQFEGPAQRRHLPRGPASLGNAYEETIGAVNYLRARKDYKGSFSTAWSLWQQRGQKRDTGRGWW